MIRSFPSRPPTPASYAARCQSCSITTSTPIARNTPRRAISNSLSPAKARWCFPTSSAWSRMRRTRKRRRRSWTICCPTRGRRSGQMPIFGRRARSNSPRRSRANSCLIRTMHGPRASTGARWKTCRRASSTAISPRSIDAVWCAPQHEGQGHHRVTSHRTFVWLCLLPLAVVTAAFFLLPMVRLMITGAEGPQGVAGYLAILTEPRYRATLINTVLLAATTTVVTLVVATIAGMFLQRHRFPGRSVLIAMLTFPLAFPGVVVGFMIILLAGRQGLIGDLSNRLIGQKFVFAYSIYGLFLGYLYFSVPRVILTIMAAVQKLDTGLEEAARSLGASPWAVQRDVVLPALAPAFVASGAIAFATAMGAFGTAFTLATNIDVLPMLIYTEFTLAANFATSAALSIGLGIITWLILALARSFSGGAVAAAG